MIVKKITVSYRDSPRQAAYRYVILLDIYYNVPSLLRGEAINGSSATGANDYMLESPSLSFSQPHVLNTSTSRGGYYVMTWGCQMNEEDSEQLALYLERDGYFEVQELEQANVILLNTCSVRAKPEDKVWSILGRLRDMKRERPELIIGVCGCMAQVEAANLARRAPHIDIIIGTGNIARLPDLLDKVRRGEPVEPSTNSVSGRNMVPLTALQLPPRKGAIVSDLPGRASERKSKLKSHVPIMYGCDKFCTFCIVPHTRGRERSRPTNEILAEIRQLAANGTREVTLLGQTVNSYGKNLPEGRVPFARLLEQINDVQGIERIRFTSPYPRDFTQDLIETIARLPHVCEHVHLPLQVGDDVLLKDMHRGYTVSEFKAIVHNLRTLVPGIAITTDIMLGHPGETDVQFENTLETVRELRFDSAFMFAYSPRPNTPAAVRSDQVEQTVKMSRLNKLIDVQNLITQEVNAGLVGSIQEVLIEGASAKNRERLSGYTRTLKLVNCALPARSSLNSESFVGKLVPVLITDGMQTGLLGEILL